MKKVYLLGAGLGKLEYLSIRGHQLLNTAEVLIYDDLIDFELLKLVPKNCLQIYAGKRGGKVSTPQARINQLLVAYSLQEKQVVRLKAGDPGIFGRVREEIEALDRAGCAWEIVPGISSAIAAPLLAGIPLTDKHLSRSFVVLSGHQPETHDWGSLAKIDTLVILMGVRTLEEIVKQLLKWGRSPFEPIAVISNAATATQQIVKGTLANITESSKITSPAVIVIGKIVEMSQSYSELRQNWHSHLPLEGKKIVVTRAAEQASKFTGLLRSQGATVIEMPALAICPPSSWAELDRAIAELHTFDWLILTSSNGVDYFFDRLIQQGKDTRALADTKIAVVGKKTAASLTAKHLKADFIPPQYVADSLVEHFPESLQDKRILFPRVETGGREVLVKELNQQGANVVEVAAYQSACPNRLDDSVWQALQTGVDAVTFASAKTVKNFSELISKAIESDGRDLNLDSLLSEVVIASIGPQTSLSCQQYLARVDLEAAEYTLEGLTTALVDYYKQD